MNASTWYAAAEKDIAAFNAKQRPVEKTNKDEPFNYPIATVGDTPEDNAGISASDWAIGVRPEFIRICDDGPIEGEIFSAMPTGMETTEGMQFDRGYASAYMVTDTEKMEALIAAVNTLKEQIGIKKTIADYGVDEKTFLASLDEMSEAAFDDQCTGANPRYPLISEIKEMYLRAYYGDGHFAEKEMPPVPKTRKKRTAKKA